MSTGIRNYGMNGLLYGTGEIFARAAKHIAVGVMPFLEPIVGPRLDELGIWELQAREPLVKARLGAAAIAESRRSNGDRQLHDIGVAMAVTALADVHKPTAVIAAPEIPEAVKGIVGALLSSSEEGEAVETISQVVAENEYISPQVAAQAENILNPSSSMQHIFP